MHPRQPLHDIATAAFLYCSTNLATAAVLYRSTNLATAEVLLNVENIDWQNNDTLSRSRRRLPIKLYLPLIR